MTRANATQTLRRLTAGAYSRLAGRYDRTVTRGTLRLAAPGGAAAVERWARQLGPDDAPILDVPTGTGRYLAALPAPVVGVDLAAGMLERAARRAPEVPLVRADAFALPFPDGAAGAAFTALGLQLFPRPGAAIVEMARVVRPGGVVHGVVPAGPFAGFVLGRGGLRRTLAASGLAIEVLERRRLLTFFTARKTPPPRAEVRR